MYNQCGLRVKSDIMNVFVEFIESFKNLTPILWVSQIAGLIGLLIVGVAYLFEKRKFLAISTIAVLFFIVEQSCALLYSNLIVTTSCLIRNILMYVFLVKSNKEVPLYILGLLLVLMWAGIITYLAISQTFDQWDNYLPPAIVTMSTFTQNIPVRTCRKGSELDYRFLFSVKAGVCGRGDCLLKTLIAVRTASHDVGGKAFHLLGHLMAGLFFNLTQNEGVIRILFAESRNLVLVIRHE